MVNQSKIEEVRKAIKKSIEKQKMFIENEPECSGDPSNTIAPDQHEGDEKNEQRNPKQK